MSETPKAPAQNPPEPSAFERMKDFTRRIVAVPKSEVEKTKRRKRRPAR
jgi:hypothetical protein